MNQKKIESVIKLPINERYDYFVRKVAEFDEVWGLFDTNGWAIMTDNEKRVVVPFWPEEEFAKICCTDQWSSYLPKMIPLSAFVEKWLPGMKQDNRVVNIFYTPESKDGSIIDPDVLLNDLKDELAKYD
jgi:Protein of unknown function (DUF2750)